MRKTYHELMGEVTRDGKYYQATHSLPQHATYLSPLDLLAKYQEVIHYYLDMMVGIGTVDLIHITWSVRTIDLEYNI